MKINPIQDVILTNTVLDKLSEIIESNKDETKEEKKEEE